MTSKLLARRWFPALVAGSVLTLLATAVTGLALANAWGWGTNVGWINLHAEPEPVIVCADHLEGYAWGENVGWIRMGTVTGCPAHTYPNTSNSDYGVNRDGAGDLSGFAWGTNVGWINFDPANGGVRVDPITGRLEGYAWGENVGWIRFDPAYGAAAAPPPTAARVVHFAAHPTRDGNLVRWETATEVDVSGFNIYRAADPAGPWLQVNDALVPATGSAAVGARYELLDTGATEASRYYQLEVMEASGPGQRIGPAAVSGAARTIFLPIAQRAERAGGAE